MIPIVYVGLEEYDSPWKPEVEYHLAGSCTMDAPRWRCRHCGEAWVAVPRAEQGPRRPA